MLLWRYTRSRVYLRNVCATPVTVFRSYLLFRFIIRIMSGSLTDVSSECLMTFHMKWTTRTQRWTQLWRRWPKFFTCRTVRWFGISCFWASLHLWQNEFILPHNDPFSICLIADRRQWCAIGVLLVIMLIVIILFFVLWELQTPSERVLEDWDQICRHVCWMSEECHQHKSQHCWARERPTTIDDIRFERCANEKSDQDYLFLNAETYIRKSFPFAEMTETIRTRFRWLEKQLDIFSKCDDHQKIWLSCGYFLNCWFCWGVLWMVLLNWIQMNQLYIAQKCVHQNEDVE